MRYIIYDVSEKIKVGDRVRTNADGAELIFQEEAEEEDYIEGIVGELYDGYFYLWNNKYEGQEGEIPPSEGWAYSWRVDLENSEAWIEFLDKRIDEVKEVKDKPFKVINLYRKDTKKELKKGGKKNGH